MGKFLGVLLVLLLATGGCGVMGYNGLVSADEDVAGRWAEVENQFTRAVTRDGNRAAQAVVDAVFALRSSFEWRGLGEVPLSALSIRPAFAAYDAEVRHTLQYQPVPDHKQCECGAILRGVRQPTDCKLFGTVCTPENPMGSCMVSSEGSCAAHYTYGRWRDIPVVVAA